MKRLMDVSEAREICKNRSMWKSIVSVYPSGKQADAVCVAAARPARVTCGVHVTRRADAQYPRRRRTLASSAPRPPPTRDGKQFDDS
ncbi:hypothetical protein EVAR_86480_1 [Eumeta japonica]|uniref:Uncharacterized protein n=1 Tax=Eumeta variegata TaxID=151549 RepID=A0A4C1VR79_EUMVA|nr:hypothetical protein EVAR_86480_1 [Eumeta japonica]